jgi:Synergist-CTERM protein sorting domain-containing protein
MWETPPAGSLNISIQYLADYQGDLVITKHERDADSGETLSLKLVKFTPAAAAGVAVLGTAAGDTLSGTAGNDFFYGDAGDDEYVWHSGDGNDIINDYSSGKLAGEAGLLYFEDVNLEDVEIQHNGYDIVFLIKTTGERVTAAGWFKGLEHQLTNVQFGSGRNGRALYREQVSMAPPIVRGTEGDDIIVVDVGLLNFEPGHGGEPGIDKIYGEGGSDIIYGGASKNIIYGCTGSDYLVSGEGSADYFWFPGDGHDLINDYSPNKGAPNLEEHRLILWPVEPAEWYVSELQLAASDIEIETSGADLIFNITPTGESIRVMNWYLGRAFQLDLFSYDYNGFWDRETINSSLPILQGTDGYDTLLADASVKFVNGEGSNDYISLSGGDHIVTGGPGEDNIVFDANAPGDPNTLIWNLGDGLDGVLGDYDQAIVVFGEGISPSETTIEDGQGDRAVNAPGGGGMLFIQGAYGSGELSEIRFADGTIWDSADIEAIAEGGMAPFSMSMEQIARKFWDSLEPAEPAAPQPEQPGNEAISPSSLSSPSPSGGCNAGMAGMLALASVAVAAKRKRRRP